MKKDHGFEMTCLRRILSVTRLDKIRNTKIKESLNLDQDVLNRIVVKRLKYFGHINPRLTKEGVATPLRIFSGSSKTLKKITKDI